MVKKNTTTNEIVIKITTTMRWRDAIKFRIAGMKHVIDEDKTPDIKFRGSDIYQLYLDGFVAGEEIRDMLYLQNEREVD